MMEVTQIGFRVPVPGRLVGSTATVMRFSALALRQYWVEEMVTQPLFGGDSWCHVT
jgi:hypothetical protein